MRNSKVMQDYGTPLSEDFTKEKTKRNRTIFSRAGRQHTFQKDSWIRKPLLGKWTPTHFKKPRALRQTCGSMDNMKNTRVCIHICIVYIVSTYLCFVLLSLHLVHCEAPIAPDGAATAQPTQDRLESQLLIIKLLVAAERQPYEPCRQGPEP